MSKKEPSDRIPFVKGRANIDVFQDTTPLIQCGLNAHWNYDNNPHDLHVWNTAFGFEETAEKDYIDNNHHRIALSEWLMNEHSVAPNTVVLLQVMKFSAGSYLR